MECSGSWLLEPYRQRRTYRTAAYLLMGLPLGIVAFTMMVTGLSLGLGLIVTLIGIPILVVTLLGVRALAGLEAKLASALLDAPMPRHQRLSAASSGFFWERLHRQITDRRLCLEMVFLVLRLPLGIAGFAFLAAVAGLAVSGVVQPILVTAGVDSQIGGRSIDTFAESLVYIPISVVFLLVGPRLVLGAGAVAGRVATSLLGRIEAVELKRAVAEVLARTGESDGFAIFDELEFRFGRGAFLTPTRVEATLLSLQSTGRVSARRSGVRNLYRLAESPSPLARSLS